MTNEFKENILNYITNNITPTSKSNVQLLESTEQFPRDDFIDYLPSPFSNFRIEGVIKSITNGNYILYGGYVPSGTTADVDSRGIIIILDSNLMPIKTIYQFSTGTNLRPIQKMIQIDDGTFVAVDSTIFSLREARSGIQSNTKRFIMLNNLSLPDSTGNYKAILRTSYNLPYSNFFCIDMIKNPNSSHYAMAGATYIPVGNSHYDGVRLIDLKVNVGEANEWKEKSTKTSEYWSYGGFYGEFDNDDNLTWKILMAKNTTPVTLESWNGTDYKKILEATDTLIPYVDSLAMKNQVVFTSKDEVYFVINNQRWSPSVRPRYVGLYKYNYQTSNLKQIYYKNIGNFDYNESREGIFLNNLNGELYVNYNDNYNYNDKTANYNYQRLENDTWQPILIAENVKYSMERELTFTSNVYNLVTNLSINSNMNLTYWHFIKIKEIYNDSNYNSTPYTDYNSMIPTYTNLYDTNGVIFSRNLYNLTINEMTTTSTIQIPNTLLNDITITQEKLLSQTNSTLINKSQNITKNIYETVYLNYINSISVIDEDTNTLYPNSASYVNRNINEGTQENCSNTFVGKLQINYENSSMVQNINWIYNTDHYEAEFVIDATNEIPTSIDFMSNDETTIYITKELDISTNGYYLISQKLRIE